MSLGSEDRANEEIERAINYARTKGFDQAGNPYYFIDLVLLDAGPVNGDPRQFCVSGIRELTPLEPRPDKDGALVYRFEENQGGYTRFRPGRDGRWRYSIWDDPQDFNRNFLASHVDSGYWEIEDPVVDAQIMEIYEKMKQDLKSKKKDPIHKQLVSLQGKYESAKPDDKAGILKQMQGVVTQNENLILGPSKRKADKKKKRNKYRIAPTQEQLGRKREAQEVVVANHEPKSKVVRVDE